MSEKGGNDFEEVESYDEQEEKKSFFKRYKKELIIALCAGGLLASLDVGIDFLTGGLLSEVLFEALGPASMFATIVALPAAAAIGFIGGHYICKAIYYIYDKKNKQLDDAGEEKSKLVSKDQTTSERKSKPGEINTEAIL
jgi:hypothetical protein